MNKPRAILVIKTSNDDYSLSQTFDDCPVVWDTRASIGLAPFPEDFIVYEECEIPVQDISKTNTIVGVVTVMWKVKAKNG